LSINYATCEREIVVFIGLCR